MDKWDTRISVSSQHDPAEDVRNHIEREIADFGRSVAKLPNSGGPLTTMERTVLRAYLHHKLITERG
ncbi:MAG: hypothetical protein CMH53_09060 [Myxococcales bacterium]|jgi:hypothetical protein|nr:hypothetical protein [Myxococcales bacterium]